MVELAGLDRDGPDRITTHPRRRPCPARVTPRWRRSGSWRRRSPCAELFRAALDGATPVQRLNDSLPNGGAILEFEVLAEGYVVYRADQETDEVFEVFTVPRNRTTVP
jgi:hypothetical protein